MRRVQSHWRSVKIRSILPRPRRNAARYSQTLDSRIGVKLRSNTRANILAAMEIELIPRSSLQSLSVIYLKMGAINDDGTTSSAKMSRSKEVDVKSFPLGLKKKTRNWSGPSNFLRFKDRMPSSTSNLLAGSNDIYWAVAVNIGITTLAHDQRNCSLKYLDQRSRLCSLSISCPFPWHTISLTEARHPLMLRRSWNS